MPVREITPQMMPAAAQAQAMLRMLFIALSMAPASFFRMLLRSLLKIRSITRIAAIEYAQE